MLIGFPHRHWQWHRATGIRLTLIIDIDRVGAGRGCAEYSRVQVTPNALEPNALEEGAGAETHAVLVRDNNIDQAFHVLNKKMQREGHVPRNETASHYEKPSERATREKTDTAPRARKLARKQSIRDGLIATPKKANTASQRRSAPVAP